jgi:hypothetical protein
MVIHSFRSLPCDRSIASSKTSSPHSRSSASYFNLQYFRFSLRSSSRCLRLLPRLPVISIFPSKTCFKRQFLGKIWPRQFAFLLFIVCSIFLSSLTLCYSSSFLIRSVQLISVLPEHNIPKLYECFCSVFWRFQASAPCRHATNIELY